MLIRVTATGKHTVSVTKAETRGKDTDGVRFIATAEDLTPFSLAQLAELYNLFSQKPVKKFADRETAITRVWAVVAPTLGKPVPTVPAVPETTTQEEDSTMAATTTAKKSAKRAKKTTGDTPRSRLDEATLNSTITVLVDKNPKREGSESYDRFKLYKDGMTVADFVKKGGSVRDLRWDQAHKYVQLKKG